LDVLSVGDALWQLQRLLAFLRSPPYGVDGHVTTAEEDELRRARVRCADKRRTTLPSLASSRRIGRQPSREFAFCSSHPTLTSDRNQR
jgi:hypothetical protein